MGTDEQNREIAEMVRERRQAIREHACLENKLQRNAARSYGLAAVAGSRG